MTNRIGARVATVATLVLLALGCSRHTVPTTTSSDFVVRLFTSEHVSGRWERAGEQALGRIAVELGADVQRMRCTPTELNQALRSARGTRQPDLVFFVGSGFESAVYTEAALHPEVRFVLLNARTSSANVAAIDFIFDEAAFLGGVVAGALSTRGVTGVIRGPGRPWLHSVEEGYKAGFATGWPNGVVIEGHGAEAPWNLVREGVKVALYASEVADPGVLAAAHDAGLLLIGVDAELLRRDPEVVVAAVRADVPEAAVRVAREVRDGSFRAMVYTFDLGSGVVDLQLGSMLQEPQLSDVLVRLEEARTEVAAGIVEIEHLGI